MSSLSIRDKSLDLRDEPRAIQWVHSLPFRAHRLHMSKYVVVLNNYSGTQLTSHTRQCCINSSSGIAMSLGNKYMHVGIFPLFCIVLMLNVSLPLRAEKCSWLSQFPIVFSTSLLEWINLIGGLSDTVPISHPSRTGPSSPFCNNTIELLYSISTTTSKFSQPAVNYDVHAHVARHSTYVAHIVWGRRCEQGYIPR